MLTIKRRFGSMICMAILVALAVAVDAGAASFTVPNTTDRPVFVHLLYLLHSKTRVFGGENVKVQETSQSRENRKKI